MTKTVLADKKILLIGAGSMAEAMIRGLLAGGVMEPDQLLVSNRSNAERLLWLKTRYGVQTVTDLAQRPDIVRTADVIVLACKPHDLADAVERLKPDLERAVLLSVAAGISTELIESIVGEHVQVVRAMPNTACAVLESATAVCFGQACTQEARTLADAVLSALGTVTVVEERLMDAVTGVSGSGPAYFYYMVEAMQQAAESLGLEAEVARTLVLQTLFGAGQMLQQTGLEAATLRRQVTSPNGTTMAGLRVLEEAQFLQMMGHVVQNATLRSREMGEEQVAVIKKGNRR